MARKPREVFIEHNFYHIYNRGNNKRDIFRDDEDKAYFTDKLHLYFGKTDNKLIAICIMKNHFHLLIEAGNNNDISQTMQKICTSYARFYTWKYSHVGHVFQGRFKSKQIQTNFGIINVINYIMNNPVRKGYSDKPGNYSWLWIKGSDLARVRPISSGYC